MRVLSDVREGVPTAGHLDLVQVQGRFPQTATARAARLVLPHPHGADGAVWRASADVHSGDDHSGGAGGTSRSRSGAARSQGDARSARPLTRVLYATNASDWH